MRENPPPKEGTTRSPDGVQSARDPRGERRKVPPDRRGRRRESRRPRRSLSCRPGSSRARARASNGRLLRMRPLYRPPLRALPLRVRVPLSPGRPGLRARAGAESRGWGRSIRKRRGRREGRRLPSREAPRRPSERSFLRRPRSRGPRSDRARRRRRRRRPRACPSPCERRVRTRKEVRRAGRRGRVS